MENVFTQRELSEWKKAQITRKPKMIKERTCGSNAYINLNTIISVCKWWSDSPHRIVQNIYYFYYRISRLFLDGKHQEYLVKISLREFDYGGLILSSLCSCLFHLLWLCAIPMARCWSQSSRTVSLIWLYRLPAQLIMKEKPSCSAAILENPSSCPPPLQAVRRQAGSYPAGSIPIPPKILVKMYKLVGKIPWNIYEISL